MLNIIYDCHGRVNIISDAFLRNVDLVIIVFFFKLKIHPDEFARRNVRCLQVCCRRKNNNGCPWKGPLRNIEVCYRVYQTCQSNIKSVKLFGFLMEVLYEFEFHDIRHNCKIKNMMCRFCLPPSHTQKLKSGFP